MSFRRQHNGVRDANQLVAEALSAAGADRNALGMAQIGHQSMLFEASVVTDPRTLLPRSASSRIQLKVVIKATGKSVERIETHEYTFRLLP